MCVCVCVIFYTRFDAICSMWCDQFHIFLLRAFPFQKYESKPKVKEKEKAKKRFRIWIELNSAEFSGNNNCFAMILLSDHYSFQFYSQKKSKKSQTKSKRNMWTEILCALKLVLERIETKKRFSGPKENQDFDRRKQWAIPLKKKKERKNLYTKKYHIILVWNSALFQT